MHLGGLDVGLAVESFAIDQQFHSLECFGGPEPNETDLVSRSWECGIEEGNFICETMLFPVPISDRL